MNKPGDENKSIFPGHRAPAGSVSKPPERSLQQEPPEPETAADVAGKRPSGLYKQRHRRRHR